MSGLFSRRGLVFFHLGILALFTVVIYLPSFSVPFQMDDIELLLGNPIIRNPALLLNQPLVRKGITFLTFSANYTVHGQQTFGYHLVNVLLHILTGFLFYFCIFNVFNKFGFKKEKNRDEASAFAFAGTLIFLLHPLQTESVTYIWQRAEVLSAFFYLASYFFYLHGRLKGQRFYYVLAGCFFTAGLLEKGTIVSLPLLIVMTEVIFFESLFGRIAGRWVLIFSWAFFLMAVFPYKPWHDLLDKAHVFEEGYLSGRLSGNYAMTQIWVAPQYVRLAFWPTGLNVEHDVPLAKSFFEPRIIISCGILFLLIVSAVKLVRRNRWAAFGIFWFFICLLPTSFVYREAMWDRRTYLSVAGFGVFVTALVFQLIRRPLFRHIFLTAVILFFSVFTIQRNFVWQSPIALLEDAIRKSPRKVRPNQMLGALYLQSGREEDAVRMFRWTIKLSPTYPEPYNNLGVILARRGHQQEAVNLFLKAASLRTGFVIPYLNLGDLMVYGFPKDYQAAIGYYKKALETEPLNVIASLHLASVYFLLRDYETALRFYDQTIRADPRRAEAYFRKGEIYWEKGSYALARDMLEQSRRLAPDNPQIDLYLSKVYEALGDQHQAQEYSREGQRKMVEIQENRNAGRPAPRIPF